MHINTFIDTEVVEEGVGIEGVEVEPGIRDIEDLNGYTPMKLLVPALTAIGTVSVMILGLLVSLLL